MGLVLEALDSKLQRNVALKVLDPDLVSDEVARQRFCREARAAASITHEHVVAAHQVERSGEDGVPFLVMQLIPGESPEQRLTREKQLPLREVVRIVIERASRFRVCGSIFAQRPLAGPVRHRRRSHRPNWRRRNPLSPRVR